MSKSGRIYKPGQDNLPAGHYTETGPRGGAINRPRHIRIDQGDRLPPTQQSGNRWRKS